MYRKCIESFFGEVCVCVKEREGETQRQRKRETEARRVCDIKII